MTVVKGQQSAQAFMICLERNLRAQGKLMSEGFPLKMQLTVRAHTHTFTCKIMTYTERI